MSGSDASARPAPPHVAARGVPEHDAPAHDTLAHDGARRDYGTIAVVGGGCYGAYYVRQLGRASRAGALRWRRLLVIDRDADCRVAAILDGAPRDGDERWPAAAAGPAPELVIGEWRAWFGDYLARAAGAPHDTERDAVVPSPLMPHLMFEWVLDRARARWPSREVTHLPLDQTPTTPWARAGADGTMYVSFATWECPINCVEPARCPHTRSERDWSLPVALRRDADRWRAAGSAVEGPHVFAVTHRAFGVGMLDVRDVLAADRALRDSAERGPAELLIATSSHCHGAVGRIRIGAMLSDAG